jgi:hypothetical protein
MNYQHRQIFQFMNRDQMKTVTQIPLQQIQQRAQVIGKPEMIGAGFSVKPYAKIGQQIRNNEIGKNAACKMLRDCDKDIIRRSSSIDDANSRAVTAAIENKIIREDKGEIDPLDFVGSGGRPVDPPHPIKYLKKKALSIHSKKVEKLERLKGGAKTKTKGSLGQVPGQPSAEDIASMLVTMYDIPHEEALNQAVKYLGRIKKN